MEEKKSNKKIHNADIETAMKDALKELEGDENQSTPMDLKNMFDMLGEAFKNEGPIVSFKKVDPNAIIPEYKTEGSSGFDLSCLEEFTIEPGQTKTIDTGLKVADMSPGIEMQIRPRSGLASKQSITVLNTPGTVDNDYRGNVMIILINLGKETQTFKAGSRIAQAVCCRYEKVSIKDVDVVVDTERGDKGIGSSGV